MFRYRVRNRREWTSCSNTCWKFGTFRHLSVAQQSYLKWHVKSSDHVRVDPKLRCSTNSKLIFWNNLDNGEKQKARKLIFCCGEGAQRFWHDSCCENADEVGSYRASSSAMFVNPITLPGMFPRSGCLRYHIRKFRASVGNSSVNRDTGAGCR